jgi:UMF1 family MFS transporter
LKTQKNLKTPTADKFTKLEKSWIGYDIGNSAFTLLATTIMPLFFNAIAEAAEISPADSFAYWGLATSITTLIVAVLGPILGAIADHSGSKKKLFMGSVILGVLALAALVLPVSWFSFLVLFVIARVGYQSSLIFYDSMLTDVTTKDRMDRVSSFGFAFGYIMSCIPFILSLVFLLFGEKFGISGKGNMTIAIAINAIWWVGFTIPLYKRYEQTFYVSKGKLHLGKTFAGLGHSLVEIFKNKRVFFFLLAFFCYIDGVYTIIDLAVSYGSSLGLDSQALLLALLMTQIVAFPATLAFSHWSKKHANHKLIQICIVGYTLIAAFAIQLDKEWEFWLLAMCVGLFQGGIQALSRSYYGQLIPPEKSGEYFGIYDIFGKGAAFVGTTVVAFISKATGHQNLGIVAIVVIFIIGFFLFRYSLTKKGDGEQETVSRK